MGTWVSMLLALASVALFPDWTGSGEARPIWLFAVPIVLGLVGMLIALRSRHYWWAFVSALWGGVLTQGLVVLVTVVEGP